MAWNSVEVDSLEGQEAGVGVAAAAGEEAGHEIPLGVDMMIGMAGMGHSAGQADATDAIVQHILRVTIGAMEQGQLQLAL